jgi:hypothetical protein
MKHPVRSDFYIVVTEAGVNVRFKPTNSVYSFLGSLRPTTLDALDPSRSQASNTQDAILRTTLQTKFKTWRSASRQNSSGQFASKSGAHLRAFLVSQPMTLPALDLSRWQASRGVLHQKSPRPFG